MAQIGALELYVGGTGWVEVPVFDPADLSYTPIEVYTSNGWGALRVVDPANADTPLEVYTSTNGWMGISGTAASSSQYSYIDGFESGNVANYTNRSDTGSHDVNASAARSGTYGYESQGEEAIWSVPGSGLNNYPADGKTFEYYVDLQTLEQVWLFFGGTTDADQDRYQIELISDGDFRVRVDDGGNRTTLASTGSSTVDYSQSGYYRVETRWSSGGGFAVDLEEPSTGTTYTLNSGDATFTGEGKVGYRTSGNCHVYIDDVREIL